MAAKKKAKSKKPTRTPQKKASKKKVAKKTVKKAVKAKSPANKSSKKVSKKKTATASKSADKIESKGPAAKGGKKKKVVAKQPTAAEKRRSAASAAMEAALGSDDDDGEEEEFDPAAFFAASGGQQDFRPHVMRKERVDFALMVRYRNKGPLVFNAELLNLSKGGLCLQTPEEIKVGAVLRVEIPLPHTSELFAVQAEVVWSTEVEMPGDEKASIHTGLRFKPMSPHKQAVINQFIQQRRDEVIMAKIGLDRFADSVPVAGVD